jgi:hypothetical protein
MPVSAMEASAGDPLGNGQKLTTLLGAILRLDVDSAEPYAIPADNPFGTRSGLMVCAIPGGSSFDTATAICYIADVGQNQWEEINFLPAGSPGGLNFGWNFREGSHPYEGTRPMV